MLSAPPPGFNPSPMNRQQVQPRTVPGLQGLPAMGSYSHPFAPAPISAQPGLSPPAAVPGSVMQHPMMRALMGGAR
jgi:hypothetical protein